MKIILYICFLGIILEAGCKKKEKLSDSRISLDKGWKVKLGDSLLWAQANFNDSDWDSAQVGYKPASKPFDNYNGFAWYRIKINIPSSIVEESFIKDSLKFFLGAIDDCDQVYLNGKLIGENTKTEFKNDLVPNKSFADVPGLWDKKRKYVLHVIDKRILWDRENIIAIRIFDQWGTGGLYSDVPFLEMVTLKDYLSLNTDRFYKLDHNNLISKTITLANHSTVLPIEGDLIFKAENTEDGSVICSKNFEINLPSGQSQEVAINVPICTDKLRLTFEVIDNSSKIHMFFTDSIPYNLSQ